MQAMKVIIARQSLRACEQEVHVSSMNYVTKIMKWMLWHFTDPEANNSSIPGDCCMKVVFLLGAGYHWFSTLSSLDEFMVGYCRSFYWQLNNAYV